jgi:hypothetical protein
LLPQPHPQLLSKGLYLFQLTSFLLPAATLVCDALYGQQDSDLFRLHRFFGSKRYPPGPLLCPNGRAPAAPEFAYLTAVLLYLLGQSLHANRTLIWNSWDEWLI